MLANIVSLFIVLFMVFGSSNPASCKGGDEGSDKPSGLKEYQSLVSERKSEGYTIKVDLSEQILTLDVPGSGRGGGGEGRLYPTPEGLISANQGGASHAGRVDFVSASILSAKAKQFDDGLYAAAEMAVEEGLPGVLGKKCSWRLFSAALRPWVIH